MAALSDQVKTFVVQALACFEGPQRVADMVLEEFGIKIERSQVANYDPNSYNGKKYLGKRWRVLFDDTREAFRKEASQRPIAERAWRLAQLERIITRNKSDVLKMQALELSEKILGKWYTGRATQAEEATDSSPAAVRVDVVDARAEGE